MVRRPPARLRAARRALPLAACVLASGLVLTGCAQVRDQVEGARVDPASLDEPLTVPILETVEVGLLDGMVSILVRNPSDRVLRHADAAIEVLDRAGRTLAGSPTSSGDTCCTVVNLPPGQTFGFHVQMADPDDSTDDGTGSVTGLGLDDLDVSVAYEDVSWGGGAGEGGAVAAAVPDPAAPLVLTDPANPAGGVTVSFLVDTSGGVIDRAVAQAVLTGPDGALSAVVSGTLTCLDPADNPASQVLQLFHEPVPGTTVSSVSIFPVAEDRPTSTGGSAATDPSLEAGCPTP